MMDIRNGILAAASDAPLPAIAGFEQVEPKLTELGALDSELRAAHMIGQCAHESTRFTRVAESLFYTTVDRLMAIFGRHFLDRDEAAGFLRNSEKLANRVYANRNGNGPESSGDGFRYRGRGYIQLTGRANYRRFGARIEIDLENNPELAKEPGTSWLVAASYMAKRKRGGKTAFQWADENNVEAVTRIINGGTNGLTDRRHRTARALVGLGGIDGTPRLQRGAQGPPVELLQRALAAKGFSPGAIDGDFGPATERAVRAFQTETGLNADGIAGDTTWEKLKPLPS